MVHPVDPVALISIPRSLKPEITLPEMLSDEFSFPTVPEEYIATFPVFEPTLAMMAELLITLLLLPPATKEVLKSITPFAESADA